MTPGESETGSEAIHRVLPTRSRADPEVTRTFAVQAARMLHDDRCDDVVVLDVRELSQVCDYLVVASGTSDRQMSSAADDVAETAEAMETPVLRRSQDPRATWIVLDSLDVVVHIFEPQMRAHYDLELLWGDAPHVEWRRPEEISRDRAGLGGDGATAK